MHTHKFAMEAPSTKYLQNVNWLQLHFVFNETPVKGMQPALQIACK